MPYIEEKIRPELEPGINMLADKFKEFSDDEIEGIMNYTITELINRGMKRPEWRYKWINRVVGVLGCVLLEFYRRVGSEREDLVKEKNGDINAYLNI
jgi:hypothetical protein